ncbi:hypothetical protein [Microbacterium sp. MYb64]|uniref:hypothetical protein n=1 Tax=Microbacterium sp. MYb64 TaxID=1848691 RepID=UPI000CFC694F|nr:hypothetical protein [Microbacterium sp. MYb64]PRB07510.1 hypothetical protein CQ044_05340 [Microbacterium sp. MYb64]
MLLGTVKATSHSDRLAYMLDNWAVDGHVIGVLYRMRTGDYVEQIRPFLQSQSTWIRNEAKRHLAKYDPPR